MLDNLIYLGIIVCSAGLVLCVASIVYQTVLKARYEREIRERAAEMRLKLSDTGPSTLPFSGLRTIKILRASDRSEVKPGDTMHAGEQFIAVIPGSALSDPEVQRRLQRLANHDR